MQARLTEGEIFAVGGNRRKNGLMDAADLRAFPFTVEFAVDFPGPDGGGGPRAAWRRAGATPQVSSSLGG
jgi:hypothetical protein